MSLALPPGAAPWWAITVAPPFGHYMILGAWVALMFPVQVTIG